MTQRLFGGGMPFPVLVLLCVFALIALRQTLRIPLRIWQIMLLGAVAVLLAGSISPAAAGRAIDPDVMLFLFGMFVVGHAMEESGYLAWLASRLFSRAHSASRVVVLVLAVMGLSSTVIMNDSMAIVGTPVALWLARRCTVSPQLLLLALAFGVTIGSVPSPIGNPQNLLIAQYVGTSPFVTFGLHLFLPTLVNLGLAYLVLRLFYRREFHAVCPPAAIEPVSDARLAALSRAAMLVVLGLVAATILSRMLGFQGAVRLSFIAAAAAAVILAGSRRRVEIARGIDWATLVFFAAMFVLMRSAWDSGFFQSFIDRTDLAVGSLPAVFGVSVLLSQLVSNVPLVALYLPVLGHASAGTPAMMALAAGSTIAGNLMLLGAASNVIIVQNTERRGERAPSFWEFLRAGSLLTALNVAVYWGFLLLF